MGGTLKKFFGGDQGTAGVEFALVLPFMLILFVGIIDATQALSVSRRVDYAATVVADVVAQRASPVTAAQIDDAMLAATLAMRPTAATAVRVAVYRVNNPDAPATPETVTLTKWRETTGGSACTAPSTTSIQNVMGNNNDVIIGVVCTTYTPTVGNFFGKLTFGLISFTFREQIAVRPRQSATMTCTGCS